MSLIYASFFEDIKMARTALHSHVFADLPKAAVPSHIPQPLQLKKKKKSKTPSSSQPFLPSSLHPSLHQLNSEYAMSLLSLSSPPFMMSWWEAQCTLLKWIFSNQGAAWLESSCQQEITVRPTRGRYVVHR